ncbi:zf-DBF domain protein, partial [Rhizoctonia solani AG-3 Rhs1AP]
MLSASTITAVATAPPRVPNHKRARSPDPDREEDDAHKRSRGSAAAPTDTKTADPRTRERLERQQQREHYRNSYLKAFPGFVFYFDDVDEATKHRQSQICKTLGARIEPFFSRNVTHVITSCPRPRIDALITEAASNKENNPKKNQDPSRSPAKASVPSTSRPKPDQRSACKAIGYGIKIWETIKLSNILDSITHHSRASRSATPSAQPTLEHLLATERIHGTHERDPTARRPDYTYYPRNSYVLLVEDLTGVHATIASRDFGPKPVGGAKPGWPVCYAHPDARGPFEPPKPDRKERGRERERDPTVVSQLRRTASLSQLRGKRRATMGDQPEHEQEDEEDPDADQPGYIAASGNSVAITSNMGTTSTAVSGPGMPRVRSTLRVQALSKGTGAGTSAMPPPRIRKAKSTNTLAVRLPTREEKKKPGYCENCRSRFEDFDQHVNGTKHRKFATKDSNFRVLDQLLDRIQRRPIEQIEYYDEDDDSYHYGGLEDDVGDSSEDYGELLVPSLGEFDFMMDRRIMTHGKARLDSDVIVVEPGDTQEEDQDVPV